MIVCGIDPGTARVGWAFVESLGQKFSLLHSGCITTEASQPEEMRLSIIYTEIVNLFRQYNPTVLSIESLFFTTNAKTVIPVAQARGIVLLAAAQKKIPIQSISPLAVKKTICGDGRADKKQVEQMIMILLKLSKPPKPDDTVDAIAIALAATFSYNYKAKTL